MKNRGGFLLCLLLSSAVWFVHVLSQTYSALVEIPVLAQSNIDGRSSVSSAEVIISARCSSSGHHILRLSSSGRPVRVFIDKSDFEECGADLYRISSSALARYVPEIFGQDVVLESFIEDYFDFKFTRESHVKVPVTADFTISYRNQYMALREMSVTPDSVIVYGEPSLLAHIDRVRTEPVSIFDVHTSRHGNVRLDAPKGVRLSSTEALWTLDVTRFVEIPVDVSVTSVNVPRKTEFLVFPPVARVVCRCVFPLSGTDLSGLELRVDYNDFASSISGRVLPYCPSLPQGVIDYTVSPSVFDCAVL